MSDLLPLREVTKRTEFFASFADLAMRVARADDAAEVTALLCDAATLVGADAAAFASFVRDDETYESYRFILACDARWCLEYEDGACHMHDPWIEYARLKLGNIQPAEMGSIRPAVTAATTTTATPPRT